MAESKDSDILDLEISPPQASGERPDDPKRTIPPSDMSDTLTATDRAALAALGLTLADDPTSTTVEGTMQVELKKWGPFHFHLRVVLPGGAQLTGFTPRTRIVSKETTDDD